MSIKHTVSILPGDGIGPEIMEAVQQIIKAARVNITWEECVAGKKAFEKGITSGVPEKTIASIAKNGVAIKGPLETPIGYGDRSANVTLRKLFETYGNIRPAKEIPGLKTAFSGRNINLLIVRENIEDLYAGIEYHQTPSAAESIKLITKHGCEKISRLAFELALSSGRKKVHCATKANIMKFTEGMFKHVFEEVSKDYPNIESNHIIIDNCAHQLVVNPEQFEIIVTSNLNGDILSDLASGLIGGLGVAPSANIGDKVSIFESVHGSAPDIAGKNLANPTALLLSACLMLRHLKEFKAAQMIEEALVYTLQEGKYLTADLTKEKIIIPTTTTKITQRIIENFGKKPANYLYGNFKNLNLPIKNSLDSKGEVLTPIGADVFIQYTGNVEDLASKLYSPHSDFELKSISCRGMQVWPKIPYAQVELMDLLCCHFLTKSKMTKKDLRSKLLELLAKESKNLPWMHIELVQKY